MQSQSPSPSLSYNETHGRLKLRASKHIFALSLSAILDSQKFYSLGAARVSPPEHGLFSPTFPRKMLSNTDSTLAALYPSGMGSEVAHLRSTHCDGPSMKFVLVSLRGMFPPVAASRDVVPVPSPIAKYIGMLNTVTSMV